MVSWEDGFIGKKNLRIFIRGYEKIGFAYEFVHRVILIWHLRGIGFDLGAFFRRMGTTSLFDD